MSSPDVFVLSGCLYAIPVVIDLNLLWQHRTPHNHGRQTTSPHTLNDDHSVRTADDTGDVMAENSGSVVDNINASGQRGRTTGGANNDGGIGRLRG